MNIVIVQMHQMHVNNTVPQVVSEKENRGKSEEKRNVKLENVKNLAVVVKFNSIICIYGIKNWRLVAI